MPKPIAILFFLTILFAKGFAQYYDDSTAFHQQKLIIQYKAVIEFSDAAINSIAALNSLIKKENYRNKISSFNNPTSSDMGFNLQLEINTALKPLLDKAKHVNTNKFMDVVGSFWNWWAIAGSDAMGAWRWGRVGLVAAGGPAGALACGFAGAIGHSALSMLVQAAIHH